MWLALDVAATAANCGCCATFCGKLREAHRFQRNKFDWANSRRRQCSAVMLQLLCCVLHVPHTHTHTRTHTQLIMTMAHMAIFQLTKGASSGASDAPAGLIRVEGFDSIRNCSRLAANCSRQQSLSLFGERNHWKTGSPALCSGGKNFFLFIYSPRGTGMWQRGIRQTDNTMENRQDWDTGNGARGWGSRCAWYVDRLMFPHATTAWRAELPATKSITKLTSNLTLIGLNMFSL